MEMRASRSRTRDATNLLTSTPDEFVLGVIRFLLTARDLLSLRLSCRQFNMRCIAAPAAGDGAAAAAPEMCIVEDAGRRWVALCSEQERGWVSHLEGESWLSLMHEVALLRVPLLFGRAHANLALSEGGAVATMTVGGGYTRAAASTAVMRSGRHFAQFTVLAGSNSRLFGVLRPCWDVEEDSDPHFVDGHCFINTDGGSRYPGSIDWEGKQPAREQGDRIGMLLDLDQGSMTIWKNNVKLGVMVVEGLSGPLCWAADMYNSTARIESAPAPASPTEEELAAAQVWQNAS